MRIGFGYDAHQFAEEKACAGGIEIDFELQGHSDADVLVHAIDALLGAAARYRRNFPDSDSRYKGFPVLFFSNIQN